MTTVEIQELQLLSGSRTVTLGNQDWQCHRLCEHLDHTLLHGLRHVTPGYWKIVTEFTHKDCVKEIKRMRYVTTDLGRGRAWLFMALNENLLECYLRCFLQNESLVEDYYVRDALVRDQDRFNVLLTLTSGLENISFNLECDVPYLDLCVHPPKSQRMSNVEATVDFDRLSVCSMESVHLPSTGIKPLPQTVFESSDVYGTAYKSSDKDSCSVGSAGSRHSPSVDSGVHSDWNYRQRSITPVDQLGTVVSAGENEEESNNAELEVIRLSKKGKPHKHKKKKKRFVSVSSIVDSDIAPDSEQVNTGPTIEIPPLDDFKLMCAIQNSSQTDSHKHSTQSPVHNAKSRSRSPGDGHETPESKSGNVSRTNNTTPVLEVDKVKTGTQSVSDTTDSQTSSNRDSGIFTEMIKAKVSDIVDAGDTIDYPDAPSSEHNHVDRKDSCDIGGKDIGNVQYAGDDSVDSELLGGLKSAPSFIYDGKDMDENTEVSDNIDELQSDERETEDTSIYGSSYVNEEPSIYGNRHDSDSSSDTDNDVTPLQAPNDSDHSRHSSRAASSCGIGPATSRSGSALSRTSHTPPVSRGSTPSVINEQNKMQHKSSIDSSDKYSAVGFYLNTENEYNVEHEHKDTSVQNTPNSLCLKGSRPSSALSKSSANEFEVGNVSANRLSASPTNQDKHVSASESADEDKVSLRTRSTNPTPDSDIAASETALQAKVEELIEHRSLNTYTHLTFGEEEDDEDDQDAAGNQKRSDSVHSLRAGEVELDNNSMLYLMLDVVEGDDVFIKMFCCRQGHTEGKTKLLFVLFTTCSLYLLQQQQNRKRFSKLAEIPFTDIDFVSLGFNNQILHIACKAKRNKHWLTTGDERVTIALVDCLADSMEKSSSHPARLEVDTGNTIQKISLHKYLAMECRLDADEVEVVCYSLVHWEDPSSNTASCEWDREGTLYYKSIETATILGTQTWRLGYAVLKDSMLCLYNDKSDAKPTHFLSISGGQCVGCKRDFNADKNHAIKVMMEDGSFWTIALESEDEANSWLQGLCQAVSEGLQMNTLRPSCIPCCMLLSQQKLLMCHEDLETNFLRTLGSASLQDVTGIMADDINNLFMILVFESADDNVSNERWVLYFNSDHECTRFRTALSDCWASYYQVEVPLIPMDDFALQKKCIEMANLLKSTLSLS